MNSILPIHFGWSSDDADAMPLAIDRLGLYLDLESETLVHVLNEAGCLEIAGYVSDLSQLHLEPECADDNIRQLLLDVRQVLVRALNEMANISINTDQISSSDPDFDTRVNWVCARLKDIIATLDWALK